MDYIKELQAIVGADNVRADEVERLCYSRDMSVHVGVPDVIAFAETTEQVAQIMGLANEQKIPVIPRGSGTSVTGAVLAPKGGIVLDLSRMNRIKEINREDRYAVVEPGVILNNLNAALAPTHFYPPDPSSAPLASIGGTVSTNASGERAVKYGGTKDWVLCLEMVLADGRVLRTGTVSPKSSAGFDLTHLFIGSEGTLGVVTEVTVRILPTPEYAAFGQIRFRKLEEAGDAVTEILTSGILLSKCEVLDSVSLDVVKAVMGLEIPEEVGCILFLQMDGHRAAVEDHVKQIGAIAEKHHSISMVWTDDEQEMLKIWEARGGLTPALSKRVRGERLIPIVEDSGVPITKIPAIIKAVQELGEKYDFPICTFGHVGDGNIHPVLIMDPRKKEHWEKARQITSELIDLTIELGGTLTAEHGTGMAKSPFIGLEMGEVGIEVMRAIKKALDPNDILNPGKMGLDDTVKDIYDHFAFTDFLERPDEIISYGTSIDNEVMACIQCGFCRLGCPIFAETGLESRNARGHVILAHNLMTGAIEPSEELAASFYQCTTCLNCQATCPAGVVVSDIVEGARRRLVVEGYLPDVFAPMLESLGANGNPFGEPPASRTEVYPAGFEEKTVSPERCPEVPPEHDEGFIEGKADVLLYLGCVGSYQDLYIVPSMMKLMDKVGVNYAVLGDQEYCCGYLAYLIGSEDAFEECLQRNKAMFSKMGVKQIVTTCAGCYRTFADLYPKHSDPSTVSEGQPELHTLRTGFDVLVLHAVQFMEQLIDQGKVQFTGEFAKRVIYHDPCDIGRHLGIYEPPRNVLKSIPGLELIEFKLNRALAKCCGGGGGMKAYDNDLSAKLADNRVAEAMGLGAEVIVSACPSCKSNLKLAGVRLGRERRQRVRVMDITEVLAEVL